MARIFVTTVAVPAPSGPVSVVTVGIMIGRGVTVEVAVTTPRSSVKLITDGLIYDGVTVEITTIVLVSMGDPLALRTIETDVVAETDTSSSTSSLVRTKFVVGVGFGAGGGIRAGGGEAAGAGAAGVGPGAGDGDGDGDGDGAGAGAGATDSGTAVTLLGRGIEITTPSMPPAGSTRGGSLGAAGAGVVVAATSAVVVLTCCGALETTDAPMFACFSSSRPGSTGNVAAEEDPNRHSARLVFLIPPSSFFQGHRLSLLAWRFLLLWQAAVSANAGIMSH